MAANQNTTSNKTYPPQAVKILNRRFISSS
jgi:hypothetical protein